MTKRTYTAIFTIISTIVNIFMTMLIILALISLSSLVLSRVLHIQNGQAYIITWMLCFLVGLIAGMFIFARLSNWVIAHFKMESKLDARFLGRYLPTGKKNQFYAQEEKKPKTNLPASALPRDEEDEWEKEAQNAPYSQAAQGTPPEESLSRSDLEK